MTEPLGGRPRRLSVAPGTMQDMHLAIDDTTPRRRIAFGTHEAAAAFVAGLPGWSVADPESPGQPAITGSWDDSDTTPH